MVDVYRERIAPADPRLRRNIHHDSRSKRFPYRATATELVSTRHNRVAGILDQGNLGSCTGNAGIGCLGTDPFFSSGRAAKYSLDEDGAVKLYSDATQADGFPGNYPPEDTGSDGLTIAKVLTAAGEISGYRWTFSLQDALLALVDTPFITGTYWTSDMFEPTLTGQVRPTGTIQGGHEYVADELDVENQRIWFTNSWGTEWGAGGRFFMSWEDYGALLSQDGDVTVFVPVSQPAPIPEPDPAPPVTPVDPTDLKLWDAVKDWAWKPGLCGSTTKAKKAVREWGVAKGL